MWQPHINHQYCNLSTNNCKINEALLPFSHSGFTLSVLWMASYYPSSPRVSLPLGWLVSDRLHTHHTSTRKRTCTRTHSLELMKIQPHPRLSNGPNNRESLGASRVSGRLQDACGLDGQVLGSDTPTLTHANTMDVSMANTYNSHLQVQGSLEEAQLPLWPLGGKGELCQTEIKNHWSSS